MKTTSNQKWLWPIIQALFVITLLSLSLSGCGGSSGSSSSSEDDATASSDASLLHLTLAGATLDQLFQPNQTAYSASVNFLQASITLTPFAADAGATIRINGTEVTSGTTSAATALVEGQNLISLVVTAADGVTTQSYSIEILREDADLFAQQAYLKASNADEYDWFGTSVAISGDTMVVGAPYEDSNASGGNGDYSAQNAGAAYVFTRSGGVWRQQAYLKASNAEDLEASNAEREGVNLYWLYPPGDLFGRSVAISGDTLVVGAPQEGSSASGGEDDNSATHAGAVYVFTRSDGIWSQQAYLKASNAEAGDWYGTSVAISGDTLVVGAPGEDSSPRGGEDNNWAEDSGAAYVFTRSAGIWSQQAMLKAKNPDEDSIWIHPGDTTDQFGESVAISDDTLVVGAPTEDSSTSGGADDNSTTDAGAAYVFTRSNGVWSRQAFLKASNSDVNDYFGTSVAISGDTLVVGAPTEDSSDSGGEADNLAEDAGAAYVFIRGGEVWRQQAYLKASNAEAGDWSGTSVTISGDTLVVGASYEDSSSRGGEADNSVPNAGAAYIWQ
ncbi:MAG: cadherin-like beta sandwich domain-containing protein [Candidatus Thiodiazotropha sp.]